MSKLAVLFQWTNLVLHKVFTQSCFIFLFELLQLVLGVIDVFVLQTLDYWLLVHWLALIIIISRPSIKITALTFVVLPFSSSVILLQLLELGYLVCLRILTILNIEVSLWNLLWGLRIRRILFFSFLHIWILLSSSVLSFFLQIFIFMSLLCIDNHFSNL